MKIYLASRYSRRHLMLALAMLRALVAEGGA